MLSCSVEIQYLLRCRTKRQKEVKYVIEVNLQRIKTVFFRTYITL